MPLISPRHLRYARYAHFGGSLRSPRLPRSLRSPPAGGGVATLRSVTLSGLPALSDASLVALARGGAARSLRALDISWSRGVTDAGLGALLDAAPRLARVVLWGATQLTSDVFLGHARAPRAAGADAGAGADAPAAARAAAPPPCRAHPDLAWRPVTFVGRPGDAFPAAEDALDGCGWDDAGGSAEADDDADDDDVDAEIAAF